MKFWSLLGMLVFSNYKINFDRLNQFWYKIGIKNQELKARLCQIDEFSNDSSVFSNFSHFCPSVQCLFYIPCFNNQILIFDFLISPKNDWKNLLNQSPKYQSENQLFGPDLHINGRVVKSYLIYNVSFSNTSPETLRYFKSCMTEHSWLLLKFTTSLTQFSERWGERKLATKIETMTNTYTWLKFKKNAFDTLNCE